MAVKSTCTKTPYVQLLSSLAQLGNDTFICMGPGMELAKRVIYTQYDIYTEEERINKYAKEIAELIRTTNSKKLEFIFDFLFKTPDRNVLSLFAIHDYQCEGIKEIYKGFKTEVLNNCRGDMKELSKMTLPIESTFLRVGLKGFEPKKINFTTNPRIKQNKSSKDIEKSIPQEVKVIDHYKEIDKINALNGRIVNANIFFEALAKQGIELKIDNRPLTFENYILYTLSGNNPENTIKIPRVEEKSKIITLGYAPIKNVVNNK